MDHQHFDFRLGLNNINVSDFFLINGRELRKYISVLHNDDIHLIIPIDLSDLRSFEKTDQYLFWIFPSTKIARLQIIPRKNETIVDQQTIDCLFATALDKTCDIFIKGYAHSPAPPSLSMDASDTALLSFAHTF